jgi:Septum formation
MSDSPGMGTGTTSADPPVPAPPTAPPARRSRLAIGLTALIGVLTVAAAVVTAVILTHRPHHAPAPAHPLRGTVFELRSGQCINFGPNGSAVAHVIPCAQPHDAEIYSTFRVAGRHWPGTAVLGEQARQGCQSRLTGYVNPQLNPASLTEFYVYPNPGAWAAGGRSVICEIRGTQGKLTGSVRAAQG